MVRDWVCSCELPSFPLRSQRKEMSWLLSHGKNRHGAHPPPGLSILTRDSFPFPSSQAPPTASSASSRISPAALFTIVILALIFFVSGLLHLLVRFLIRKRPSSAASSSSPHSNEPRRAADLSGGSGSLQRQLRQLFHLHDSGLDQAFIDALPLFLYKEILGSKDPFDCAVCLSEFTPEDKLRLLPGCGHAFHLNCIDAWLLSNSTCPLCRGAIFLQGLTYVVADSNLQVTLSGTARNGDDRGTGYSGEAMNNEGMRLGVGYRDESFSVSKIWQWSERRGKFPPPTCADAAAAFDGGLPWLWPDLEDA
ncbi:hypothetical protein C4D60_Mb06t36740 [Musa balbisiana]|uniref:RING-type E3 ubiquitin transferase n=1 Tax=Musa balbisiana TaxID=52838 RepID=A0A4S8ITF3_MUSBA|nr:hypothetical protein C4D60_Mb06t36740 [Musa balbisiana]